MKKLINFCLILIIFLYSFNILLSNNEIDKFEKKWETIYKVYGEKVYSIAIDNKDSKKLYIGTSKDLYKSIDGGESWVKKSNGLPENNINSIIVDQNNSNILYVAAGPGVYKSIDGGENWVKKSNGLPENKSIFALEINPNNSKILYAGLRSNCGVYKSIDGGENWVKKSNG
ncbi:MAG: YCF48-related protein, partial [Caldisericia bacterium]|nr:YCF48-related protein [Caldisericia bacterium]